jgi:hypothetical protein
MWSTKESYCPGWNKQQVRSFSNSKNHCLMFSVVCCYRLSEKLPFLSKKHTKFDSESLATR